MGKFFSENISPIICPFIFTGIMSSRSRSPSLPRVNGDRLPPSGGGRRDSRSPIRRPSNAERDRSDDRGGRRDRRYYSPRRSSPSADSLTATVLKQLQQQQQSQAASLAAIQHHLGIG